MVNVSHIVTPFAKPLESEAVETHLRDRKAKLNLRRRPRQNSLHSENENEADLADQTNILSVKALILFMEDFIEARLSDDPHSAMPVKANFAPWLRVQHSNTNESAVLPTVKAANAYNHSAQTINNIKSIPKSDVVSDAQDSLRTSYTLLRDLRDLQLLGVQVLRIDSNTTFLNAVFRAVEREKFKHLD